MAFNRSKRPRLGLGLGLGLPIAPFGTFGTLRLHLYMLPHEVVTSPHQRVFRHISMLRGVLRVRIGCTIYKHHMMIPGVYFMSQTITCTFPS